VLNPGFGGPALTYLLGDVVPEGFAEAAKQAALAAAAAGVGSSEVSSAAGVDVVQPGGQLQVQRQLLALLFWQHYAGLEGRYQEWKQARNVLVDADGPAGAAAVGESAVSVEEAVALVNDMLALAQADALRLSAPGWLAEAVSSMSQSAAAAAADAGAAELPAAVPEGAYLNLPQYDVSTGPRLLAAYAGEGGSGGWIRDTVLAFADTGVRSRRLLTAQHFTRHVSGSGTQVMLRSVYVSCAAVAAAEGTIEQTLGLQPHSVVQLAVTVSSHQPGLGEASEAAADMSQPHRRLQVSQLGAGEGGCREGC
jgi:hypothetical protein